MTFITGKKQAERGKVKTITKRKNIWKNVEEIILEHYDEVIKRRLRGGFYIVRDYLSKRIEDGRITEEEFTHFLNNYNYYSQDLWASLEQKYGLERPEAKPIGVIYDRGRELPISSFEEVYERARGFIFVEKADEADDIRVISKHGWAVVAGQGFSTRLMRKLFKEDTRPVLALHDSDTAGEWIYKVFDLGSRRTKHLDLKLDRVDDLGLTEEDATALNLPKQPEAEKYRDKRKERVELSALSVIPIDNPVLAYTVAKMKKLGYRITPTPAGSAELMKPEVAEKIVMAFIEFKEKLWAIQEYIDNYGIEIASELEYPDIELVTANVPYLDDVPLELDDLVEQLKEALNKEMEDKKDDMLSKAEECVREAITEDEDEYEERIVNKLAHPAIINAL